MAKEMSFQTRLQKGNGDSAGLCSSIRPAISRFILGALATVTEATLETTLGVKQTLDLLVEFGYTARPGYRNSPAEHSNIVCRGMGLLCMTPYIHPLTIEVLSFRAVFCAPTTLFTGVERDSCVYCEETSPDDKSRCPTNKRQEVRGGSCGREIGTLGGRFRGGKIHPGGSQMHETE